MVDETVPALGDKLTLETKLDPEVVETSYPLGGVTTISAAKLEPETEKDCSELTTPEHAVNVLKVPEVETVGVETVTAATSLAEHPLMSVTVRV